MIIKTEWLDFYIEHHSILLEFEKPKDPWEARLERDMNRAFGREENNGNP